MGGIGGPLYNRPSMS